MSGQNRIDFDFLVPDWPAPDHVKAVMTTKSGGVSTGPYQTLNLGDHVNDDIESVEQNRQRLVDKLSLPSSPRWLSQVHGTTIVDYSTSEDGEHADAVISYSSQQVCSIMTADCLPVLFCNQAGTVVAGAHAGWRGLQAGILEKTVQQMKCPSEQILVWLGAAISQENFEVGSEVRDAFMQVYSESGQAFIQSNVDSTKWYADIYELAKIRLVHSGVDAKNIFGGGRCTFKEESLFFSYRRQSVTGRMAALIWATE